jgi:hypothetical protein
MAGNHRDVGARSWCCGRFSNMARSASRSWWAGRLTPISMCVGFSSLISIMNSCSISSSTGSTTLKPTKVLNSGLGGSTLRHGSSRYMRADQFIRWPSEPTQVTMSGRRRQRRSPGRLLRRSPQPVRRYGQGSGRPRARPSSAVEQRAPGSTRRDYATRSALLTSHTSPDMRGMASGVG